MNLAHKEIKIPEEWRHDVNIKNSHGWTVAMHFADKN